MGIFESIEKLITEHGSAAILKERLSLVAEQHAALERENEELQRKLSERDDAIAKSGHLPLKLDLNKESRGELLIAAPTWDSLPPKLHLGYGVSLTATSILASTGVSEMLGRATEWLPFGHGMVRSGWLFHAWSPIAAPDHTFFPFQIYSLNARHAVMFFKVHVASDNTGYIHLLSASEDVCVVSLQTSMGSTASGEFYYRAIGGEQKTVDTWSFSCDYSLGPESAT
jgi:hypothetical protein